MTGRKVLFSAQKNEGPFILEWVAYHKVIGFTDIVVVSNDCDDGSDDLLDALADAGEVMHIRQMVPEGASPQLNAELVARRAGMFRHGDWVMWLDLDEFLLPSPPHESVADLIDAIGPAKALFVAWRFFGDSENAIWPGRHVSDRFTLAAERWRGRQAQGKTLFRYGPEIDRLWIHLPILKIGISAHEYPAVTSANGPIRDRFYLTRRNPNLRMPDVTSPYVLGQVAHFSVRTRDFFKKKQARGDGLFSDPEKIKRDERLFDRRNFNNVAETGLALWSAKTSAEMRRLMDIGAVAHACAAIEGFKLEA